MDQPGCPGIDQLLTAWRDGRNGSDSSGVTRVRIGLVSRIPPGIPLEQNTCPYFRASKLLMSASHLRTCALSCRMRVSAAASSSSSGAMRCVAPPGAACSRAAVMLSQETGMAQGRQLQIVRLQPTSKPASQAALRMCRAYRNRVMRETYSSQGHAGTTRLHTRRLAPPHPSQPSVQPPAPGSDSPYAELALHSTAVAAPC